MKNLGHTLAATWLVMSLLAVSGCSHPVLDYRNAEVSDGLVYAGGANEPFTGTVTHVPDSFMIQGEGHTKFMHQLEGDKYDAARLVRAVLGRSPSTLLCTIAVRKGYVDGEATCYRPQTDVRVIEAHFANGQLAGKFVYYNPGNPDQKLAEGSFEEGQPDGKQVIYSASTGELVKRVNWSLGLYDGRYTSYNEANGKVVLDGAFAHGRREGTWVEYAPAGKPMIAREVYKQGLLEGIQETFDATTGQRTSLVDQWVHGKISGTRKTWNKNGALTTDETYAAGVLVEHRDVSAGLGNESDPLKPPRAELPAGTEATVLAKETEAAEAASSGHPQGTSANLDDCVNDWTKAHRKAVGEDAEITMDQLAEWRDWCGQGKHAPM